MKPRRFPEIFLSIDFRFFIWFSESLGCSESLTNLIHVRILTPSRSKNGPKISAYSFGPGNPPDATLFKNNCSRCEDDGKNDPELSEKYEKSYADQLQLATLTEDNSEKRARQRRSSRLFHSSIWLSANASEFYFFPIPEKKTQSAT